MNDEIRAFIERHRTATLAVCGPEGPLTSMVSYVAEPSGQSVLVHLSSLAPHKPLLLANPACSLLIADPDDGRAEPMSLKRLSLSGRATKIEKGTPEYEQAKAHFLARIPASRLMFELPDFDLFRIAFTGGRYTGGFGKAVSLQLDAAQQAQG